MSETGTTDQTVIYNPLNKGYLSIIVILGLLYTIGGYVLAQLWVSIASLDVLLLLGAFLGLPLFILGTGFYLGWKVKRSAITYNPPEWQFKPIQFELDEAKKVVREHNKKYSRLVALPNYWYYFLPIVTIIVLLSIPLYDHLEYFSLLSMYPLIFPLGLLFLYAITYLGGWRSSSTPASDDFNLVLIRETMILGKNQSKVPGISQVRFVIDAAEHDGHVVYRDPRIILRINGIESSAYIETWTQDKYALERMYVRLKEDGAHQEVIWWFLSHDRNFKKFDGEDRYGYYSKIPVKSRIRELGVRDVRLVTMNAVAIIIMEWNRTRGDIEGFSQILSDLGVE
ncbi:MAG: hypothetical protein ACTSUB_03315 [Candidatus Thorarchaeota archaeon]